MSGGEVAYLGLVLAAFATMIGAITYGIVATRLARGAGKADLTSAQRPASTPEGVELRKAA